MALYDQMYIFVDGALEAENVSIDTGLETDLQRVMTVVKGFAGISPSPIVRTVKAENVSPISGDGFDFESAMLNSTEHELMLQQGGTGVKCVTKGYFSAATRSAGVGKTLTKSWEFVGTPSAFE